MSLSSSKLAEFAELCKPLQDEHSEAVLAIEARYASIMQEPDAVYLARVRTPYANTSYWDKVGPQMDGMLLRWRDEAALSEMENSTSKLDEDFIRKLAALEADFF